MFTSETLLLFATVCTILLLPTQLVILARPRVLCTPPRTRFIQESVDKFTGRKYPEVINVIPVNNRRLAGYLSKNDCQMILLSGPPNIFDRIKIAKEFPKIKRGLPQYRFLSTSNSRRQQRY